MVLDVVTLYNSSRNTYLQIRVFRRILAGFGAMKGAGAFGASSFDLSKLGGRLQPLIFPRIACLFSSGRGGAS